MLAGKQTMIGQRVVLELWQPIAKAPKTGRKVSLRTRHGYVITARWLKGAWRKWLFVKVTENPADPFRNFRR